MVATMMAELELEGLASQGSSQQLMTQTDAEDGNFIEKLLDLTHDGL